MIIQARDVFKTHLDIYGGVYLWKKNFAVNYFPKTATSQVFDWVLKTPKYASGLYYHLVSSNTNEQQVT